jgi:hypothetical protein
MRKTSVLFIAIVVLALAYPASKTFGQAVFGSIIGTVSDSTGAIVPDAKIIITDVNKGVNFETRSNESGNYQQTHLIVGTYRVRVEKEGFQAYVQENVQVNVDAATAVNAVMQLGAVTQTVEVTAAVPLLKTERTDVSTTFTEQQVKELPIFNRNFTQFELLSPGTQRLGWQHASSENPQGSLQIMVNGQHFSGTGFQLDGTDNRDPILGIIVINPSLDGVTEAKITSQDYDAEFGQATAGVVTSQTKSGSNDLHGSAFWFRRDNNTTSRDPFAQVVPVRPEDKGKTCATARCIPPTLWNQFGGSLGGPIKKDKTFIFGDYQGTHQASGGSRLLRVPNAAERAGDLSDLGVNIYNPRDASGGELAPALRQQLVGNDGKSPNVIPTALLSPQAQNILKLVPLPNIPGAAGTANNYTASAQQVFNSDAFDVRADHYYSDKTHLFGRYSFGQYKKQAPGAFGLLAGGPDVGFAFAGQSNVRNQSIAGGFDYTLRPTWLTDFRFGFFRYRVFVNPNGVGTTPAADAGIPGLNLDKTFSSGTPFFSINGNQGAFQLGYSLGTNQCNCPLDEEEQQFQFVNNWTHIRGNHTLKFGADIRYATNLRVPSDTHRAGELQFNSQRTEGPSGGGLGLAAFLLGDVSTFGRFVSTINDAHDRQNRWFFYGQDTFRITPKLTVNYGLRWEVYFPETVNGVGKGGWVQLSTGEVWVGGTKGIGLNGNVENSLTNFAPRVGVAYQVRPKTVVRLGYGRSFDIGVFGSVFGHSVAQNLPVLADQEISPANDYGSVFALSQGPAFLDPNSILTNQVAAGNVGSTGRPLLPDHIAAYVRPPKMRVPTVDAWNATVQHQLTPTMALEVAYVGNKGTHVFAGLGPDYDVNQPTLVGFTSGLSQSQRKPFFAKFGWEQNFHYFGNDSNNNYNSLQVKLDKRFVHGFTVSTHYTLARAYFHDSDYWTIDPSVEYGPDDFQRTHVFVFTSSYELPFGKGRRWAGSVSKAVNYLIGGWQLNGTATIESGVPFTPSYQDCGVDRDTGPCRPDKTGVVGAGTRSGAPDSPGYWFQTTGGHELSSNGQTIGPWRRPKAGTFGNITRNSFRGPSFWNSDISLFKNFQITERLKGQFRFETFNTFNHINLDNPDGCVDCGTGGRITDTPNFLFPLSPQATRQMQFAFRLDF